MGQNLLLTYLLLTPIIGGILVLFYKPEKSKEIRWFGLCISIVAFLIALILYVKFDPGTSQFQFVNKVLWIKSLNISYHVGIDGISLLLLLLTTFLTPLTLLSSWKSINKNLRMFTFSILFLEAGIIGVFISLDLFLFYIFWEAMLIPMYFIIGIWGGERRIYASVKFFLFTMAGSLLMLIAIIWLAVYAKSILGYFTTDLPDLYGCSAHSF
jgi:NADH-quinone oxidoreductase subunit M